MSERDENGPDPLEQWLADLDGFLSECVSLAVTVTPDVFERRNKLRRRLLALYDKAMWDARAMGEERTFLRIDDLRKSIRG